jgi:hypothetical protein
MRKYKGFCLVREESVIEFVVFYEHILLLYPNPSSSSKLGQTSNSREEIFIRLKPLLNIIYLKFHFGFGMKVHGRSNLVNKCSKALQH